jgi:predicted membrane-bound spermidine synthase
MTQFVLYLVFVLSGAAGLIYESIWSRYLGLFVGHSAYAQIIVLTIFLGGMSLGAWGTSRRSEQLKQPLLAYAMIELTIGGIGFVFHDVFVGTTAIAYDSVFPHLAGSPLLLTVVKWTIASALILPQSVLLGTTFPLMSAGVLRLVRHQPGRVLSLLYFANSLGASAGVLVAGFFLLPNFGLEETLITAAILNWIVFIATLCAIRIPEMLAPRAEVEADVLSAATPASEPPPSYPMPLGSEALWRLLLLIAFGTAIASFVYEISWIRLLSLVLGSATHSFDLMLSAFIFGLALGALWVHWWADRFKHPLRALAIIQLLMGGAAMATITLYLWSFRWMQVLVTSLSETNGAYDLFSVARYAICVSIMVPATFFAGMTLPVITKLLIDSGRGEKAVGTVYAVNTLGSIVGVIVAGLVLMPLLGLKTLLISGAVLDMALGVYLLYRIAGDSRRAQTWAYAAAIGVFFVTTGTALLNTFDKTILASGVFRHGGLPEKGSRSIVYYKDGRTATVTVGQVNRDKSLFISTNGKPDASLDTLWYKYDRNGPRHWAGGDVSTQILLPLMVLAHAPRGENAAVIGEGSGMTSHLLLGSPYIKSLTTIEIEPAMIEGSRAFKKANWRVFADTARSHFAIDDAKSFFATNGGKFDLIVSEPSNPWVSGVSGLFTVEFYARVKNYLTPNGVFGQWLHLYEINDGLVMSVLAAIHRNFASYDIFMTSNADILIVASNRSTLPAPDWSVFDYPLIAEDLRPLVRFRPEVLESYRVGTREQLTPLVGMLGSVNSDYMPILDIGAEKSRFLHESADGLADLRAGRFDVISAIYGETVPFDTGTITPVPSIPRSHARAVGAVLHARRTAIAQDSLSALDVLNAMQRRSRVENGMASGRPPSDWRIWMGDALAVEKDLDGGTAGVVDEDYFRTVNRYLASQQAPAGARQTFAFIRAFSLQDFKAASALADTLNPGETGATWLALDDLRDAGTIAKIRTGDIPGAHAYWRSLGKRATRADNQVRSLLIVAYMIAADQALHPHGAPVPPEAPPAH